MFSVVVPARVHIGLHQVSVDYPFAFGGLGFCVGDICWHISAAAAATCSLPDDLPPEMKQAGHELLARLDAAIGGPGCQIEIKQSIPEHVGLGSKTAFLVGLLYARCKVAGKIEATPELVRLMNRGGTSGIGISRFLGGGFLFDVGRAQTKEWAPSRFSEHGLVSKLAGSWPAPGWSVLVMTPKSGRRISGLDEASIFKSALPLSTSDVESVASIVLYRVIPAMVHADLAELGKGIKGLQDVGFKKREWDLQSHDVHALRDVLYGSGADAVGLSSMGPTVYTILNNDDKLQALKAAVEGSNIEMELMCVTRIENRSVLEINR